MPRGFPGKFGIIAVIAGKEIREVSRDNLFRVWAVSVFGLISFLNILLAGANWHAAYKYLKYLRFMNYSATEPSSIPATATVFSTILLSLAAYLVSFQSARRDYILDSSTVFAAKDYPNLVWFAGKAAGIFASFMSITFVTLLPALLYNIFDPDSSVGLMEYIFYPAIVSIPTYSFIIGAAFLLATLVGNQILAAALLILCVAPVALFVAKPYCWIFDLFAIRLPILKSEIAGFPDMGGILYSRSIPFLLGISALVAASLCYKRLVQSRAWKALAFIITVSGALAAAGIITSESVNISNTRKMRNILLAMDEGGSNLPTPAMKKCDIRLRHSGDEIVCEAKIIVSNEGEVPLESYLFTLNPGLAVARIEKEKTNVPFDREYHHLIVRPGKSLDPGGLDTFAIYYGGTIDEEACCLYASEKSRMKGAYNLDGDLAGIEKRLAVVKNDMLILPRDVLWYPAPGVQYDCSNPFFQRTGYCRYSLNVKTADGLTPVSQGRMSLPGEGRFLFVPETPLAGISLFVGRYSRRSIEVDSTNYEIYSYADHDMIAKHYLSIADTVEALIKEIRREKESNYGLSYPFNKFSIVEVPAFYSGTGNRMWSGGDRVDQPEMRLVMERGFEESGRYGFLYRNFHSWRTPGAKNEKNFGCELFISRLQYRIMHEPFYSFSNSFSAPGVEYFGKAVDSYLESRVHWEPAGDWEVGQDPLRGWDYLSMWLHGCSLPERSGFGSELELSAELSVARGVCLLNYLEARFDGNEFASSLNDYIDMNRFKRISLDEFCEAMSARLGEDIRPIIDRWVNSDELPGFIVGDAVCSNDRDSAFSKIVFEAFNGGRAPGVFCVRYKSIGKYDNHPVYLEAGESRTIEIPCRKCPDRLTVHTMLSQNLPSQFGLDVIHGDKLKGRMPQRDMSAREGAPLDPSVVIVDNEDPGFVVTEPKPAGLRKLFSSRDREKPGYISFRKNRLPRKMDAGIRPDLFRRLHENGPFLQGGKRGEEGGLERAH